MNKILKRKLSKQKYLRITAMIVSIIMLLSSTTILTAFKIDKDGEFNKGEHRTESIENLTLNNLPEELKRSLDMSKVAGLDTVDAENLSTFTTINNDGSRELTINAYPIKYIDNQTGKIEFKDNTLIESTTKNSNGSKYAYENKANDIKTYLPQEVSGGIKMTKDNYTIEFTPLSENGQISKSESKAQNKTFTFAGEEQNIIEYKNIFAKG